MPTFTYDLADFYLSSESHLPTALAKIDINIESRP
jgi:hypothetical protein